MASHLFPSHWDKSCLQSHLNPNVYIDPLTIEDIHVLTAHSHIRYIRYISCKRYMSLCLQLLIDEVSMSMHPIKLHKETFTLAQAAKICGVSRVTIWRWVKANDLPATTTLGGHHRILKSDLSLFITGSGLAVGSMMHIERGGLYYQLAMWFSGPGSGRFFSYH